MPTNRTSTRASPRVRAKRERRRGEILHAALRAVRENGYFTTTLDDIAAHLGVNKTALYHYFPDKEAILYACHRESLVELRRLLRDAVERYDTATEQLRYLVREHVRVMTETLEGSPLAFEVTALSPEHQRRVIDQRDRYERGVREIIARGIENGEFRSANPKISAFAILGAINWIARWYRPTGTLHATDLGEEFADHLVGGLACRTPL